MAPDGLAAVVEQFAYDEVQLQIGNGFAVAAFDEAACFGKVGGQHAGAFRVPFKSCAHQTRRALEREAEGVGELRAVDHGHDVGVIVQVLAHTGQVVHDVDA